MEQRERYPVCFLMCPQRSGTRQGRRPMSTSARALGSVSRHLRLVDAPGELGSVPPVAEPDDGPPSVHAQLTHPRSPSANTRPTA